MIPVIELRGGLLAASLLKVPMLTAIPICLIGNIIPMPFMLFFIKFILRWMKTTKLLHRPAEWLEEKANKHKDKILRIEFWGLLVFVGIPIPGTGGYTGALVASLFDMDVKRALGAIILGFCMATVIMLIISYGIIGHIVS